MPNWPATRNTLLTRLRDPGDRTAWEEFCRIYQPLVHRYALSRGLQDADARDITQRVLWSVARAADHWKPSAQHGQFRGWLAKVTRNATINLLKRERQLGSGRSTIWELLEQTPDPASEDQATWDSHHQNEIFRAAAHLVRPSFSSDAWDAFWRTAVNGEAAADVALDLGKSIGAIYASRSRIVARIRQEADRIRQAETWLPPTDSFDGGVQYE